MPEPSLPNFAGRRLGVLLFVGDPRVSEDVLRATRGAVGAGVSGAS